MLRKTKEESEQSFKNLLSASGLSEKAASEMWKWYDPVKKGVASF
jgi:hypothetical protein